MAVKGLTCSTSFTHCSLYLCLGLHQSCEQIPGPSTYQQKLFQTSALSSGKWALGVSGRKSFTKRFYEKLNLVDTLVNVVNLLFAAYKTPACTSLIVQKYQIAVITVEPAVQCFSHESEAFGLSFWREFSVYLSSILMFSLFCRTSDSFYRWWSIAQPMVLQPK